jgi:choline dehydrogenase-like flavoprotein
MGASIHYAGTVPMTREERELTVTPACRLRGARSVYLADGSVLPYLPAKALTLTLMANAERVGTHILGELQ